MSPTRQIAQPTHGGFCNDYPTCYAATPLFAQSHHSSSRHFRGKKGCHQLPPRIEIPILFVAVEKTRATKLASHA